MSARFYDYPNKQQTYVYIIAYFLKDVNNINENATIFSLKIVFLPFFTPFSTHSTTGRGISLNKSPKNT